MAIITTIYTFHEDTAFDASEEELNGKMFNSQSYESSFIWLEPSDGYDGTAYVELSPDGGDTWFVTSYRPLEALDTYENAVTFNGSDTAQAITMIMPEVFEMRVRLVGGSAGTLTVKARITDGRY